MTNLLFSKINSLTVAKITFVIVLDKWFSKLVFVMDVLPKILFINKAVTESSNALYYKNRLLFVN